TRQMLGDQDRNVDRVGERAKQLAERVDAAGRGADSKNVRNDGRGRSERLRRRCGGLPGSPGDATEQADLAQQGGAVFLVELPRTRLGESVGRTQRERRKGMFGASYGEGGHDEYPGR